MNQLRVHLDSLTALDTGMPVVRIIAGDDNLGTTQALLALQQDHTKDPVWEVFATLAHGSGYHIAVSGAAAQFQVLPAGKSFLDRGMRDDQHDDVPVVLTVELPEIAHTVSLSSDEDEEAATTCTSECTWPSPSMRRMLST